MPNVTSWSYIRKALEGNQEDLKILIMQCYGFKKSIWLKVINIICVLQLFGVAGMKKGTGVSLRDTKSRLHFITNRMNNCKSILSCYKSFLIKYLINNNELVTRGRQGG